MQTAEINFSFDDFMSTFKIFYYNLEYFSPFVKRSESVVELEFLRVRRIYQKQYNLSYLELVEIFLDDAEISINFSRLPENSNEHNDRDNYTITLTRTHLKISSQRISDKVLAKLIHKFIKFSSSVGYKKRVHHDLVVKKSAFQNLYYELKMKYKHWINNWNESQDPLKDVFEEIAIAAFLIILFNGQKTLRMYKFVDLGCGNGFLTFILVSEGYSGIGVDLQRRDIWKKYPNSEDYLFCQAIEPSKVTYDSEWLIGNHSDELTPWIPILARQTNSKFMVLPCCFYNLDGSKFKSGNGPKYGRYLDYVEDLATGLGFIPEREALRIPSTKNISIIARGWNDSETMDIISYYKSIPVKLRKTDQQKTREYFEKRESRASKSHSLLENELEFEADGFIDFHIDLFD